MVFISRYNSIDYTIINVFFLHEGKGWKRVGTSVIYTYNHKVCKMNKTKTRELVDIAKSGTLVDKKLM